MNLTAWLGAAGVALALLIQPALANDLGRGNAEYRRGHYTAALNLIKPLAQRGDPFAQFSLGVMYDDGRGMAQNYGLALKWYRRAAENGLADAQYAAGMSYAAGRGMKQDVVRAYVWLNLAAAGGYPDAERARDQEESELSRAEAVRAQAIAADWLRKYPGHLICGMRGCIHPRWLGKPAWTPFDTLNN